MSEPVLNSGSRMARIARHFLWSRFTFLYLPCALIVLAVLYLLTYERLAVIGYEAVRTSGLTTPGTLLSPCKPVGSPKVVQCGMIEVFENRANGLGRKLPVHFVVSFAEKQPAREPVFFFDGGPGVGKATIAGFSIGNRPETEKERDLVFVDIRGTGQSNPLSCVGINGHPLRLGTYLSSNPLRYGKLLTLGHALEDPYDQSMAEDCRQRLSRRADLTQYTTTLAAADIDEVRDTLGYGRINLIGSSYGTRLALEYMRRYPERVRSVILSDPVPIDLRMPSTFARDTDRALELVLKDCAENHSCRDRYPNLRADLNQVLDRLRRGPIEISVPSPASFGLLTSTLQLRPGPFALGIRDLLYSSDSIGRLPAVVTAAAGGEFEPLVREMFSSTFQLDLLLAKGQYLSVTCAEDVPHIDLDSARQQARGTILGDYRLRQHVGACSVWPRGSVPDDWLEPVVSNIPTLLFNGEFDPSTPPWTGRQVVRHLSNGLHVILKNESHGGEHSWDHCTSRIEARFLETGSIQGLDVSCAQTIPPIAYQ